MSFEHNPCERFKVITLRELHDCDIPDPEMLIEPFLPCGDIAMIAAERGVGKTQVSVGLAVAAATGTQFLRFFAPKPRRVLFIDGEMGASQMKRRFQEAQDRVPNVAPPDGLFLLIPNMCLDGIMPDLGTADGRADVDEIIAAHKPDLVVIDNISTLFRSGLNENEAASWVGPQQWLVSLKSRDVAVLLVHHMGKNGQQRGTSMREDVLGCSIRLKRPADYVPEEGARFLVEYSKARNLSGEQAAGFEAALVDGRWVIAGKKAATLAEVVQLKRGGMSIRDIAEATGSSKSSIARLVASARASNDA